MRRPMPLLTLTGRVQVTAAAEEGSERARRTITGTIVPYGVVARLSDGELYRFAAGALTIDRPDPAFLLGHDHNRPIGVLAELENDDDAARARFRVDETPDGDTALTQAASGSRRGLSVGAEPVEWSVDDSGEEDVIHITRAAIRECSLVAVPAFADAGVASVAATAPTIGGSMDTNGAAAVAAAPAPDPAAPAAAPIAAHTTPVIVTERPRAELDAGEMVSLIVRAQHGDTAAHRYIEAALTETISTDVSGLLPPQYERTVIGGKPTPRPLYEAFRSRALPGVGLAVTKPKWTTRPVGAWAATVDADATSTKVAIGTQTANVLRWDWAGALSWVVVQRAEPGMIDLIYGEAVENFYLAVETSIATLLAAAATDTATSLGAAVAKFFTVNARTPDVIICAPDVWGKLADRGVLQQPIAAGGVATQPQGLSAVWGGIPIVASGAVAATFTYLATRRAIDARVTEPVQLTANAIGALNVELAVVGEGLFDTDYPAEIIELVPTIPAPTGLEAMSAKK